MPELSHAKHLGVAFAEDGTDLVVSVPVEEVSGGAGFVNVSGTVSLDLSTGRAFHHTMTGSITTLSFTNAPTATALSAMWTWVLRVDASGPYTLPGSGNRPVVTFVDGHSWNDADLTANAENVFVFWQVGTTTYGALITNGNLLLDPYKVCFLENAEVVIMTEAEDIDVANYSQNGDGNITYGKNQSPDSGAITTPTTFAVGDRLHVKCASATGTTAVRIPRYAL